MPEIIVISGPCGCGKTTFSRACAERLANADNRPIYVIHGDDFHRGFVGNCTPWEEILRFNWDCMMATAERALKMGQDVWIDYVLEDELPRVRCLADAYHAELYYLVLTAEAATLEARLRERGSAELISRSLFLKEKLESMAENQGHLYDNTHKSVEEMLDTIDLRAYRVKQYP